MTRTSWGKEGGGYTIPYVTNRLHHIIAPSSSDALLHVTGTVCSNEC